MYDLDGTDDEDAIDITPEFMKHEDPEVEATDATEATEAVEAPETGETPDGGDDKE
jgi:hypothetical protein